MKVFVNIPNRKNLVVFSNLNLAGSHALQTHLPKSKVSLTTQEYREKDNNYVVRTAKESEALELQNWFKTNPLEVQ